MTLHEKNISQNFTDSSTAAKESKKERFLKAEEQRITAHKAMQDKIKNTPLEESTINHDSEIKEEVEYARQKVEECEKQIEALAIETKIKADFKSTDEIIAFNNTQDEKLQNIKKSEIHGNLKRISLTI